jgi:hypothetical protein
VDRAPTPRREARRHSRARKTPGRNRTLGPRAGHFEQRPSRFVSTRGGRPPGLGRQRGQPAPFRSTSGIGRAEYGNEKPVEARDAKERLPAIASPDSLTDHRQQIRQDRFRVPEEKCIHEGPSALGIPGGVPGEHDEGILRTPVRDPGRNPRQGEEAEGSGNREQTRGADEEKVEIPEGPAMRERERGEAMMPQLEDEIALHPEGEVHHQG